MFSQEAMKLVKPCFEAIKSLAERQKCPECEGKGWKKEKMMITSDCSTCKGTGKLKWEWEPEVGESYIFIPENKVYLIEEGFEILDFNNVIPILHWERIRKILKQFGYSFSITSGASGGQITVYGNVGTDKLYEKYHNNDLQCAVMQAVIDLAKKE